MRSTVSYMRGCSPLKLAIGKCANLKRFSMSAVLICCTQISSKRCTRVLSSDVCCEHDAVAASFAAELVGAPRLHDQRIEALRRRADLGETDRAGDRQRVVRALEDPAGDAGERVLRPRFDVAQRAALEEQREHLAAETPIEIVRLRELAQLLGDLNQDVLARERPDLLLELAELVGPDVRERAHAAAVAGIEPIRQHLEEPPPVIEARRGILVHGLLDELLRLACVDALARHAELDRRVAVDATWPRAWRSSGSFSPPAVVRHDLDRLAAPLASAAGDERAFERRLARRRRTHP